MEELYFGVSSQSQIGLSQCHVKVRIESGYNTCEVINPDTPPEREVKSSFLAISRVGSEVTLPLDVEEVSLEESFSPYSSVTSGSRAWPRNL